jgi:DNA repair photolyase
VHLVEVDRKGKVLTRADFGCLRGVPTLNVTRGCEFACTYCYARAYPEAPVGEVRLYRNLPAKLAAELDNPRRRRPVDRVVFNTASDCFQTHPDVLDTTFRAMRVLLERGVGFSFLTKGSVPPRFVRLFRDHPRRVSARVGLVSTARRFRDVFEPGAAAPDERLESIERLVAAGLEPEVRIDPIIPFHGDDPASIRRLLAAVSERGVRTVTLSYLHLRPAIMDQLRRELPPRELALLATCFKERHNDRPSRRLIPAGLRRKGYARFVEAAGELGITPLVCACKNPDIPAQLCSQSLAPDDAGARPVRGRQLRLFPC